MNKLVELARGTQSQEFRFYVKELDEATDESAELRALKSIQKVVSGASSLDVDVESFRKFPKLVLERRNLDIKHAATKVIVSMFGVIENISDYIDEDVITVSLAGVNDPNSTIPCLLLLALILDSKNEDMIDVAVKKGALDTLFRNMQRGPTIAFLMMHNQVRELSLNGVRALSKHRKHCKTLHERDIWAIMGAIFEQEGAVSSSSLTIVRNIVRNLSEDEDGKPFPVKGPPYSEDFTEEEGLLNIRALDPSKLDLASHVCWSIDAKGIMGMLLSVAQSMQQETMAELALNTLGLLSSRMHVVIMRDHRITIVRVMLNLVDMLTDKRLVSVAYVLDSFLKVKANRNILLNCSTVSKCAEKGLKLRLRQDRTAKDICDCFTQLFFHISQLPDGPAELCDETCIKFLQHSVASIGDVQLQRNCSGKETWSSTIQITSLLALINIAIESPVMSRVSEAHLHRALVPATKRKDELGLLAILASAFFIGKSNSGIRSREIPRIKESVAEKLCALFEASQLQESSLGGIYWAPAELLLATKYLVMAPHNQNALRPLLPMLLTLMREAIEAGSEKLDNVVLVVEILLSLSHNKSAMQDMLQVGDTIEELAVDARELLSIEDELRSVETLITTLETERIAIAREELAKGGKETSLRKRLSKSLRRSNPLGLGKTKKEENREGKVVLQDPVEALESSMSSRQEMDHDM